MREVNPKLMRCTYIHIVLKIVVDCDDSIGFKK